MDMNQANILAGKNDITSVIKRGLQSNGFEVYISKYP
jgi:hypothetical protein